MYISVYFMLHFDLTHDRGTSEGHATHGNIGIELIFNKPLPEAITCLLYIEYNNSFPVDFSRNFTTEFKIDTMQILCKLRDVNSLLDVLPSDLLPQSHLFTRACILIVNADPHTEEGSH